MSQVITVAIPDALVQNAKAVADRTDRRVEDVIAEWLVRITPDFPLDGLPDEQVLALRDLQLPAEQQSELDDLLDAQQEGQLTETERARLAVLMALYRQGMVAKARALKVAVGRGLQLPLNPE